MAWKKNEREEQNCRIEIEESVVFIFCGEVETDSNNPKKKYFGWKQKDDIQKGDNLMECVNKECERECNCSIEIEESLVVIICGEVDVDNVTNCIQAYEAVKSNKKPASQE